MSDDLTRAIAEALDRRHHLNTADLAAHIAAALAPLIEARVREARFSAVPGPLYNRAMGLLMTHPDRDALFIAEELKNHIGASAQRRAAREAEEVRNA